MSNRAHLPALTGLRFVLALWVVLHHLTGRGMMLDAWVRALPPAGGGLVRGGYLAVGTFFVLSGFVLARNYNNSGWTRHALVRYGVSRFARIYPVYLLSLLVVSPFIVAERAPYKTALLADYGLVLQGWTGTLPVNWNTPAWSLSCEVFFYICFPLALALLGRLNWRVVWAITAVTCFLPGVMLRLGIPDMWKPLIHLSDFVIGIAASSAYDLLQRSRLDLEGRGYWLYLPAAAAGAALIAKPDLAPATLGLNSTLRPLNALLIVGLALGGGLFARGLSTRLAVYLGKASYSLYILHIPLLWWYKRFGVPPFRWVPPAALAFVYVAGTVAVSAAVFRLVEEPANRHLRNWFCPRPALRT